MCVGPPVTSLNQHSPRSPRVLEPLAPNLPAIAAVNDLAGEFDSKVRE